MNGEAILAFHIYLLLNNNLHISYRDFMNRVTNNWKADFGRDELYKYANAKLGEL